MEDYEKLWKMGKGGQGNVYCVRKKGSNKEYAMKQIACTTKQQVNFALKEIKVLIQLNHPHIVSYNDFFLEFDDRRSIREMTVCLVMELCPGGDMNEKIRESKRAFMNTGKTMYKEATMLSWLRQLAESLQEIHERGYLHRDVKTTNIFFDGNDNVKLGDFGLAANVGYGRETAVGTPYYFAPEQLLQQRYDNKVDIWALGVVMFEVLTLRERPLNTEVLQDPTAADEVIDVITGMQYSKEIAELVRTMLQRQPSERPTAASIIRSVDQLMGTPTTAPQPTKIPSKPSSPQTSTGVAGGPEPRQRAPIPTRGSSERASLEQNVQTPVMSPADPTAPRQPFGVKDKNTDGQKPQQQQQAPQQVPTPRERPQSSKRAVTVSVPKDYPTIQAALDAPGVSKIIVEGGTTWTEPLKIRQEVHLTGLDPAPVINVTTAPVAISIDSERGSLSNFTVIQNRASQRSGESKPFAIEIRSGQWQLSHCNVTSSGGSGIGINRDADPVILDCEVHHCRQAGFFAYDGGKGTVRGCKITACEYAGVLLKRQAALRIADSTVEGGTETGIFCFEAAGVVEDCTIADNGGCGVVIKGQSAAPIVRRNRIQLNKQAGVFCCDKGCGTITENTITENAKAGLLIKTQANPSVSRNRISSGKETGVYVFEGGNGVIDGNEICRNANAGVLVTTEGAPSIRNNKINGNAYEGVWVCKKGRGVYEGNDLRGNAKGSKDLESLTTVQWNGNRE